VQLGAKTGHFGSVTQALPLTLYVVAPRSILKWCQLVFTEENGSDVHDPSEAWFSIIPQKSPI